MTKDVRDISLNLDPNFPNIYVVIDGMLITRVQVDGNLLTSHYLKTQM